jgi:hypothetical protein
MSARGQSSDSAGSSATPSSRCSGSG